jgi:adenine-specific DNA-methyltransferase
VGIRYIGSKARIADEILDLVGRPSGGRFVDAFSGTGSVAAKAANRGWAVTVNDSLRSAVSMSVGAVVGRHNVPFAQLGGYENAIAVLNTVAPKPGFLHAQYSPASIAAVGIERRYFTEVNAASLDAVRAGIATWASGGLITRVEEHLLLADLMQSANAVANISGTYGCFLKDWAPNALKRATLVARPLVDRFTDFEDSAVDVFELVVRPKDTVYFDPPYTKRQYSAYYHVLETLHAGDEPEVIGVTGLRPWRDRASEFSYKSRALGAITRLVECTPAERILLSYSNEGHVEQSRLLHSLRALGDIEVHPLQSIGRYRPNAKAAAAGNAVREYVIDICPFQSIAADDESRKLLVNA